jgi:hypothetical protein
MFYIFISFAAVNLYNLNFFILIILSGMILSKSIMLCCLFACGNIAARVVPLIEINKDRMYILT